MRYRDEIFTSVTKTADIVYETATNAENLPVTLALDMYQPTSDTVATRPAIVWVHGGGFSAADKTNSHMVDMANTFSRKGYVDVSIDYRVEPTGGCALPAIDAQCVVAMREATADAQAAVRFLRFHASTYGIDPTRIAIGGSSAGAITSLQVGYLTSEDPSSGVRAAVSMSGSDLLSPINAGDAPALLFHGEQDPQIPYAWALDTVNAARGANLKVSLESWPNSGHVLYPEFRAELVTMTTNFLWWTMDLAHASPS